MSTNCINCVVNPRTGLDLKCNNFRDALAIVAAIEILRQSEGDEVRILCDNPDGPPNNAIECNGEWTGFETERFASFNLLNALQNAVIARASR